MRPLAADHIRRLSQAAAARPDAPQVPERTPRRASRTRARRTRLHVAHGLERLALRVDPR